MVQDKTDNRLRVKAKIQLNHIPDNTVQPVNYAQAIGSCIDCQTFAVALQINLRSRTVITVALNVKCTRCQRHPRHHRVFGMGKESHATEVVGIQGRLRWSYCRNFHV